MPQAPEPADNEPDLDGTAIAQFRSERAAHEAGLSVLAAGHHYWLVATEAGFELHVSPKQADALRREVEIAKIRNRYWPPASLDLPSRSVSKLPTLLFGLFLIAVFALQSTNPDLKELGANSSQGVWHAGEWWRVLTAVTLHADIAHLSGNLLGVGLFSYLCCRYMGNGLAWLLILLVAATANAINAFVNIDQPFLSLGASTAVFAALGLLTGFPFGISLRSKSPVQARDWLIPLIGGCVVFAWMGGGNFPTDVTGHLLGFALGLVSGTCVAAFSLHVKIKPRWQSALLASAWCLLFISWAFGLAHTH